MKVPVDDTESTLCDTRKHDHGKHDRGRHLSRRSTGEVVLGSSLSSVGGRVVLGSRDENLRIEPHRMSPSKNGDELSQPLSKGRYSLLVTVLAAAIVSAIIFPMSWQLLVVYSAVGGVIGFLSTLDELPKILAFIILALVSRMGPEWMAAIAPQWHSTRWEPSMVVLGGMAAVILGAFARRPVR